MITNPEIERLLNNSTQGIRDAAQALWKKMGEFFEEQKKEAEKMTYKDLKELQLAMIIKNNDKGKDQQEYRRASISDLIETFEVHKAFSVILLPMHEQLMKQTDEYINELLNTNRYRKDDDEMKKILELRKKIQDGFKETIGELAKSDLAELREAKAHFDKEAQGNLHKKLEEHLEEGTLLLLDEKIEEEWIGALMDVTLEGYDNLRKAINEKIHELEGGKKAAPMQKPLPADQAQVGGKAPAGGYEQKAVEHKNVADNKPVAAPNASLQKPKFTPRPPKTPPPPTVKKYIVPPGGPQVEIPSKNAQVAASAKEKPSTLSMAEQWKKKEAEAKRQQSAANVKKPEQPKKQ